MKAQDIYAGKQAQQHPRLSRALDTLQELVEAFNKATPALSMGDSRSSRLFSPFDTDKRSPVWPAVLAALDELYGDSPESREEGVEAGALGVMLVVKILTRTIGFEEDWVTLKRWLNDLDSAVTAAEQKALAQSAGHCEAFSADAESGYISPAPSRFSSTPSLEHIGTIAYPAPAPTHISNATSSVADSSFYPAPRLPSSAHKGKDRARDRTATLEPQFITLSDSEDEQVDRKKRKKRSRSLSVEAVTKEEEGGIEGALTAIDRRKEDNGWSKSKRQRIMREVSLQAIEGGGEEGGEDLRAESAAGSTSGGKRGGTAAVLVDRRGAPQQPSQERKIGFTGAKTLTPDADSDRDEQEAPLPVLSSSFELLPLLPSILTSLPITLFPSLHPPAFILSHLDNHPNLNLSFTRLQIVGNPQETESRGTSEGTYSPHKNWLCLRPEQNICAASNGKYETNSITPGQPIVLFSKTDKHGKIRTALGTAYHIDKLQEGAQRFVTEGPYKWLYKGKYVLAWDGTTDETAEPLHRPGKGWEGLHPFLRGAFAGHMERKKAGWRPQILRDWGFEARTFDGARRELDELGEGEEDAKSGRKRVMRYLALRCVGFDEECFGTWDGRRGGKGKAKGKKGK
ncbi:hypothetical protein JCM11251_002869 [Rhodosporidiobolus azoricus]